MDACFKSYNSNDFFRIIKCVTYDGFIYAIGLTEHDGFDHLSAPFHEIIPFSFTKANRIVHPTLVPWLSGPRGYHTVCTRYTAVPGDGHIRCTPRVLSLSDVRSQSMIPFALLL